MHTIRTIFETKNNDLQYLKTDGNQKLANDLADDLREEIQRFAAFENILESMICDHFANNVRDEKQRFAAFKNRVGIRRMRTILRTISEFANDLRDKNQRLAAFGKGRESEDRRGLDQRQLRKYLRTMSLTKIVHYRMFI